MQLRFYFQCCCVWTCHWQRLPSIDLFCLPGSTPWYVHFVCTTFQEEGESVFPPYHPGLCWRGKDETDLSLWRLEGAPSTTGHGDISFCITYVDMFLCVRFLFTITKFLVVTEKELSSVNILYEYRLCSRSWTSKRTVFCICVSCLFCEYLWYYDVDIWSQM